MNILDPCVTEEMRKAGSDISSDLIDASVSYSCGGLGGSKQWDQFESLYEGTNMDLIKMYLAHEIDSVTAIYIAMHRAKNRERLQDGVQSG